MASTTKKHHNTTTNQPKMYVYDLTGIGSRTPEYHPTSVVNKKPASRGYIWGLKRSLKPPTKSKNNEAEPISSERPKQVKESPPVLETGRRSVSLVEDYIVKGEEPRRASLTTSFEEAKAGRLVEGRKSVSHVDHNNVGRGRSSLAREAELLQVKVMVTDMPGFMQLHAFRCARSTLDSLEKFSSKHMAYNLKKEFDKVYGPAWHCIVGSSFGSFVTHSTGCFLYFSLEKLYILMFRTKVRRALE